MVTKDLKKTKQVVLNVANNKYPFFMELLKNFDFVQIEEDRGDSEEEIIANLTEAFEQVKLIKKGKLKGRPVEEFLNEL
jgi:hypothetical protein